MKHIIFLKISGKIDFKLPKMIIICAGGKSNKIFDVQSPNFNLPQTQAKHERLHSPRKLNFKVRKNSVACARGFAN